MFRPKPPTDIPDAERADLSPRHLGDWQEFVHRMRWHRRRRFAWRLLTDLLVFAALAAGVGGLLMFLQHRVG